MFRPVRHKTTRARTQGGSLGTRELVLTGLAQHFYALTSVAARLPTPRALSRTHFAKIHFQLGCFVFVLFCFSSFCFSVSSSARPTRGQTVRRTVARKFHGSKWKRNGLLLFLLDFISPQHTRGPSFVMICNYSINNIIIIMIMILYGNMHRNFLYFSIYTIYGMGRQT